MRHARLLLPALLPLSLAACALPYTDAPLEPSHARIVELQQRGETLRMVARPSAEVGELAGGACYRVELAGPRELSVVLVDAHEQVRTRIHVEPLEHASALTGVALEFADAETGVEGRLELWSLADRVHGSAHVGDHDLRWRARLEQGGRLAAERWDIDRGLDAREAAALRRTRAIGIDLAHLVEALDTTDAETLAGIELALDVTLRAYEGRGRSELPVWSPLELE